MAHWAELDNNDIVLRVLVGDNNDPNNDEGYTWLINNLGGVWLKTSYNGSIRKNFAGIGCLYNRSLDAFIPMKPFESWILDEETATWVSPTPHPESDLIHFWDEEIMSWVEAPDAMSMDED
jgi:hypothetical protein